MAPSRKLSKVNSRVLNIKIAVQLFCQVYTIHADKEFKYFIKLAEEFNKK